MRAPRQAKSESDAIQADATKTEGPELSFLDNRPAAVAQRERAEMLNNSPRVLRQQALGDAIHNSPRMVAQRHAIFQLKRTVAGKPLYTSKAFEPPPETKKPETKEPKALEPETRKPEAREPEVRKLAAPRIVMTFGNNAEQLSGLIAENKETAEALLNPKYVIGVNVGPTDIRPPKGGPTPPTMKDAENESKKLHDDAQDIGMAVVPFTWSAGDARGKMYEFPYFEARSMLMKTALTMGSDVPRTVYAMTDRDARESTGISPEHIAAERIDEQLASEEPTLVSGPYNWREEGSGNRLLDAIIDTVNSAEEEFRNWKIERQLHTYLPEPNMFFNQKGLEVAVKNLEEQKLEGQQARESDVIRSKGIEERYNKHARVTKPAKRPPIRAYLHGVYELFGALEKEKEHKGVTVEQVQAMFDNIIQSELSQSNVREMTRNSDEATAKALGIMENTASIINKIVAATKPSQKKK